jgi:hypothetical protein
MNKQETLEEAAENYGWRIKTNSFSDRVKANELAESSKQDFIEGAKWQAERMYSEEEVYELLLKHQSAYRSVVRNTSPLDWSFDIKQWFEQFKTK